MINYYLLLQTKRPCQHRGKEIKKSHVNKESACCKGKEVVDFRKFFCKFYKKEIIANQSCQCWVCGQCIRK